MVVDYHYGYDVAPRGEEKGLVNIKTNGYGEVVLTVATRNGSASAQVFLQPDEARDVALYLQREARLIEKGSG